MQIVHETTISPWIKPCKSHPGSTSWFATGTRSIPDIAGTDCIDPNTRWNPRRNFGAPHGRTLGSLRQSGCLARKGEGSNDHSTLSWGHIAGIGSGYCLPGEAPSSSYTYPLCSHRIPHRRPVGRVVGCCPLSAEVAEVAGMLAVVVDRNLRALAGEGAVGSSGHKAFLRTSVAIHRIRRSPARPRNLGLASDEL